MLTSNELSLVSTDTRTKTPGPLTCVLASLILTLPVTLILSNDLTWSSDDESAVMVSASAVKIMWLFDLNRIELEDLKLWEVRENTN